jgi:rhomboid protease GluP
MENQEPPIDQKKPTDRKPWKDFFALFRITRNYFYTPIIIYLNIIIWGVMVAMGVHAFEPSVDSLINWGGNLAQLTLNGQPWRLLTSVFLHAGVFHLLLNMYALVQAGAILETHFGKHRYALVYLATGIVASISSAAFSDNVVSVGASGAIFGLYGLLLALLFTKSFEINPEERKSLISSTLIFIGYNVVFGFAKAGIDNAAHIGGLASGFLVGFIYYPFIKQQKNATVVSTGLAVVVLIAVWAAPQFITNRYAQYNSMIETFGTNESKAMWMYSEKFPTPGTDEAARFRERLKTEGIDLWNENLVLLNSLSDMPVDLEQRVELLKKYCQLRIESCEVMHLLTQDERQDWVTHMEEVNTKIEEVINSLEALNK